MKEHLRRPWNLHLLKTQGEPIFYPWLLHCWAHKRLLKQSKLQQLQNPIRATCWDKINKQSIVLIGLKHFTLDKDKTFFGLFLGYGSNNFCSVILSTNRPFLALLVHFRQNLFNI